MTTIGTTTPNAPSLRRAWRRRASAPIALLALATVTAACGAGPLASAAGQGATAVPGAAASDHGSGHAMRAGDRVTAMLAAAGYQDVAVAEADGYGSTLGTLGCFQNASKGGMGVHYLNAGLLDATLDPAQPEALVYELGIDGEPIGLVAHEYIVPIDAWTSHDPPRLFDRQLHRHPTLPLWVLHTWLWKDNPLGVFEDWNPAVRLCPSGVPIFGIDLPASSGS